MKLKQIVLEGFRSIQEPLNFWIKPQVTCLVGANEHGKSNLLESVTYLNFNEFQPDDTSISYRRPKGKDIPYLEFILDLNSDDLGAIIEAIESKLGAFPSEIEMDTQAKGVKANYDSVLIHAKNGGSAELRVILSEKSVKRIIYKALPQGKNYSLTYGSSQPYGIGDFLKGFLPKVVFFEASNELIDSITLAQLNARANLEFEGLLKLAGVWDKKEELFENSTSAFTLRVKAQRQLTRKVRGIWSQGKKTHTFHLRVEDGSLYVTIEDKTGTFDTPTKRSLGFRSFFSFYLALYAEASTLDPEGFIFVFDEPGIHLHPQGQKDLLKEIKKVGLNNQVLYSTHSPFMVDRNDPTRTSLVYKGIDKGDKGTKIIQKPYGNNWSSLRSLWGITMNDSFFYSDKSLLVEGTSDRIYISALLKKFSERLSINLNSLSIIDADRREEMFALVRILLAEDRKLIALVDTDSGGDAILKKINETAKKMKKQTLLETLRIGDFFKTSKDKSIEDILPRDLYLAALNEYIKEILGSKLVINNRELTTAQGSNTLGFVTGDLLVTKGLITRREDFSKTTTADFFNKFLQNAPTSQFVDLENQPYFLFCAVLKEKLGLD
ncbi:MAG: AAA family ATPase [Candidatus Pacebacteria bacterium]|nr:AAA family ATPase [Candidatus Paceibacterota bacterium]